MVENSSGGHWSYSQQEVSDESCIWKAELALLVLGPVYCHFQILK